ASKTATASTRFGSQTATRSPRVTPASWRTAATASTSAKSAPQVRRRGPSRSAKSSDRRAAWSRSSNYSVPAARRHAAYERHAALSHVPAGSGELKYALLHCVLRQLGLTMRDLG